ncbi:hypothetical protein CAPTEDRAFT_213352 [Capitella teleta]|uniref:Glycosyl hydrolase family 13 catalytic domain-containing protein n=1 Tax=Capitella teleta TaxID=283909 RepID=R7U7I9_CAPTE|nr:hypothetical protein CAPTEDRAFT_213352 [Capitella teleta]|eukprot:ELT99641.1 hypothetical protein CAPTEDRAFT_213352 [Capitella teleta]
MAGERGGGAEDLYEKYSRDPEGAPMQWSADPNAGFSSGSGIWLPLHPDYTQRNVEVQIYDPSELIPLHIYLRAIQLIVHHVGQRTRRASGDQGLNPHCMSMKASRTCR